MNIIYKGLIMQTLNNDLTKIVTDIYQDKELGQEEHLCLGDW